MSVPLAVRLATYLLVLDGIAALVLAGLLGPAGTVVVITALALSWGQEAIRARIRTRGLGAALVGVAAAASVLDLLYLAETVLDGLVHLLLFLVLARLFTADARREARVVAFLAFFMLVAASSAAFDVGFLGIFIAFLLLSTWLLLLQHVLVESAPASDRVVAGGAAQWASPRMLMGLAAGASIATFLITTALFFVIPRVGLAALPFRGKIGSLVTGFSDRVELGAYGQIQNDTSVAMRVHVTEASVEPEQLTTLRWRGIVFDQFDGRAWSVGRAHRMTLRRSPASDYRVGPFRGRGPLLVQEVFLEPIGTEIIFAAPRALRLETRAAEITLDEMGSISVPSPSARLHYRIESELETPPPLGALRGGPRPSTGEPAGTRYLQLPTMAPRIAALAREITAGSRDAHDAALRLTAHLSREYRYSLDLHRRTRLPPLEEFLFDSRSGNCEYFAAALAVMLRTLGIPSRVVGGFQRGEWNPYGRYFTVRMRDAHAWVEVYLGGAGWVSLDPSPRADAGDGATGASLYLDALRLRWYRYVINWSLRDQVEVATTIRRQASGWRLDRAALNEWLPPRAVLAGALGVAAGVIVMVRLRRRPGGGPAARAATALPRFYARLLRALARQGLRPEPGETAREFAARAGRAMPAAAPVLEGVTADYERVRFGAVTLDARELAALEAVAESLRPTRTG
jgi:transglutaminase-like putative cysteine protease